MFIHIIKKLLHEYSIDELEKFLEKIKGDCDHNLLDEESSTEELKDFIEKEIEKKRTFME